jgi:hypothetical protein
MLSFIRYIREGNRVNKARQQQLRAASRVFRVDTRSGEDSFSKFKYRTSPEGSGPYRGGELKPNERVTEPVTFATPHAPNPLYAFPRRDRTGKIIPALSVTPSDGSRGTLYTTLGGLKKMRTAKTNVVSASSQGFKPIQTVMDYEDPEEVASTSPVSGVKTTPIKNPEGFVRSRFNIKTKSRRKLKSLFNKLRTRSHGASVTYSSN